VNILRIQTDDNGNHAVSHVCSQNPDVKKNLVVFEDHAWAVANEFGVFTVGAIRFCPWCGVMLPFVDDSATEREDA